MIDMEEKIYFMPGELVTIRLDLPNKPIMMVVKKETLIFKTNRTSDKEEYFLGIRCRWFTTDMKLQEAVWNTKDLVKLK